MMVALLVQTVQRMVALMEHYLVARMVVLMGHYSAALKVEQRDLNLVVRLVAWLEHPKVDLLEHSHNCCYLPIPHLTLSSVYYQLYMKYNLWTNE
jgi:hypothetical protein